ncbi:hypothetical protein RM780_07800 [Streptomyces sp. DSM 44917]|uniref:Secreted protein n=1 Tax=Streptomyces boetiae TaxID=3075541 RepID=A0ABU2L5Z4_9ACTN|nr:hypothetical protein [Streptomyces sp. DSM 44917]MDT0306866.1 hypothetical protein [Streptomyces sp. DSM 44917]
MTMGLKPVLADTALPPAARGAGTFTSGPVAAAGTATEVLMVVHCTAASGTSPTLDCSLETSADGESWSALGGSSAPQLTAAGNAVAVARPAAPYVRVTSTVAGTDPSVTYSVSLWIR